MADATCAVDGCPKRAKTRGLCGMHYWRLLNRGETGSAEPEKHPLGSLLCSVADCGRGTRAAGYCNRHYENQRKYGNPVPQRDRPLEVRLREVGWTVTDSGCWEWNGKGNDNGYGIFSAKRLGIEGARAHRVMYECFVEPIPDDLQLRHKCDNPPCVNPDHLIPGTAADNSRDMVERGRNWRTRRGPTCANGHDVTKPGATRTVRRSRGNEVICIECNRARQQRYQKRKAA